MSLPRYSEYKDSGVAWLGEVPGHWGIAPFYSVASEREESNVGMLEDNLLSLSYGRIVQKDINSNDGLLPDSFETYQIIRPGDIVFRLTDLQNDKRSLRTAIVEVTGIITSAYVAAHPIKIDPRYLSYLFRAYDVTKVFYSMGGGLRQSMKFADLKRLPTLLPSPEEQQTIAAFLDRETGKIDALIAEQQRLVELLAEKRQAVISHAVTKGLNPNARMKDSGIKWLGEVPEHWKQTPIKHALNGIVDTEHKTVPFFEDGDYLVVRTTNIKNGKLILDGAKHTDRSGFIEWTRRGVPTPGDIMFTREAPAGEACLVPTGIDLCIGQRTVIMKVNHKILNSRFALWSLYGGIAAKFISDLSQGSTVVHFNMSDISNIPIMLTTLEEQQTIAIFLDTVTAKFDILTAEANRAIELLQERRSALISAAVTGKIDVREFA